MAASTSLLLFALVGVGAVFAAIPNYIKVCKRNDPKLDDCIVKAIENMRPRLTKGIPEYDIPPLEPLRIPKINVSPGNNLKAIGTDVVIGGASKFQIKEFKSNLKKLEFRVGFFFPFLTFDANYDVDAKILSLNLKGKGPLKANTTDVDGTGILKGHKVKKGGKEYILFDSLELKLKLKNYNIQLGNLFNGDENLGNAMNLALNENKKEIINAVRPQAEKIVSNVLLDIGNKIASHFTYDELFPEK